MGKTNMAKTPPDDFMVTTSENPLLSKQAVISKGITIPQTNLQLNSYPNTQLDLFCSDNLSFQFTAHYQLYLFMPLKLDTSRSIENYETSIYTRFMISVSFLFDLSRQTNFSLTPKLFLLKLFIFLLILWSCHCIFHRYDLFSSL